MPAQTNPSQIQTAEPKDATTNHDAAGRFKPGNRGGPGNPFARQVAQLRKALLDCVGPDDIQAVVRRLLERARDGDVAAAKLLLAYTIGKPEAAPHPDRMDADEWEGYRQTAQMPVESAALIRAGVPVYHLELVRVLRPVVTEILRDKIAADVNAPEEPEPTWLPPPPDAKFEALVNEMRRYLPSLFPESPPSPNGGNGTSPPSTNGSDGLPPPSTNGHLQHDAA